MEYVIYGLGAVVFFVLVMASIAMHEIGHLVPGKIFDVRTTQYFVGFGRTLWSRHRGETEDGKEYCRLASLRAPAFERLQHPGRLHSVMAV